MMIDVREGEVIQRFSDMGWTNFEISSLVLGDMNVRNGQCQILIERKTWNDLWSSLRDGRYREQRSRLSQWKDSTSDSESQDRRNHVIYIIEGSYDHPLSASCQRILHRLTLIHGFMIYRTQHVLETCQYLQWLYENFSEFSDSSSSSHHVLQCSYLEETLPAKKDVQTPQTLLAVLFYGVSGISKDMAISLSKKYESIYFFCGQVRQDVESIRQELAEQKIGMKKLGVKKAVSILQKIGWTEISLEKDE